MLNPLDWWFRRPRTGASSGASFGLADTASRRFNMLRLPSRVVVGVVVVGLFVACTALLYALSIHADIPNSDGATIILEGQAMAHGHLALQSWSLSLDSFWGVDAVVYMLAVLVDGVHASYLHLVPALIASAVVGLGVLLAIEVRRAASALGGALVVVALLALPSQAMALNLLVGPTHVATALWCLVAFVAVRAGRFGPGWGVAVAFLTAGLLGDLQTLVLGVVPVFVGGLIVSARCRRLAAGIPAVSAALGSVALALAVRKVASLLGAFALIKPQPLPSAPEIWRNFRLLADYLPKVFGAGTNGFGSGGQPYFTQFARGVGFILVLAAVLVALLELIGGAARGEAPTEGSSSWRTDDLLCLGFLAGLAMFAFITPVPLTSYARYLLPSAIFGSILAGRLVTRAMGHLADRAVSLPRAIPLASIVGFAAFFGLHAFGVGSELSHRAPPDSYADVAQFLEQQHLRYGVGDYWSSSIITVTSDERVKVRAVTEAPNGRLVRYSRESSASWYEHRQFRFVVYDPAIHFGNVDTKTAAATFGTVARSYKIDDLMVLVFAQPFTVSSVGIT